MGEPLDPLAGHYAMQRGNKGLFRPRRWDALVLADAPEIAGDDVEFATLPTGDVIVDEQQGTASLSPLAEAVERELRPPYRATGRRIEGPRWSVGAVRIDVRRIACPGDTIEIVIREGTRHLRLDGVPTDRRIPELDAAPDGVIRAERLDGDFWEVRVDAL